MLRLLDQEEVTPHPPSNMSPPVPGSYSDVASQCRHKKGGNRWCTMIMGMMRAAKYSETPSARARQCVLVGDNYGENKCNTDLDFCTEVVQRGWYDEIKLLYGYHCS
jgi:hypothetical protein